MKAFLLVWLAVLSVKAADVQVSWDANPEAGVTYKLYAHTNALTQLNLSSAVVKVPVGTNLTAKVMGVSGVWWFTVTALKDGLESEPADPIIGTWAVPSKAQKPTAMRFADLSPAVLPNRYLTKYFTVMW